MAGFTSGASRNGRPTRRFRNDKLLAHKLVGSGQLVLRSVLAWSTLSLRLVKLRSTKFMIKENTSGTKY